MVESMIDRLMLTLTAREKPGQPDMPKRTPLPSPIPIESGRRLWGQSGATALANPKPPAVPANLDLTLEQYFAACAAIGLLSSQHEEPDQDAAVQWTLEFGEKLARESRKRWNLK